jgi:hypothetical protein
MGQLMKIKHNKIANGIPLPPLQTYRIMVKYTHMNKQEIITTLQSGISEITYTDEHSTEQSIMGTMAQQHMPADGMAYANSSSTSKNTIKVFNVNSEQWETFMVDSIVDIEQLTGEGAANNEKKLQAGTEYMEGILEMTASEEMDSMEYPEEEKGEV